MCGGGVKGLLLWAVVLLATLLAYNVVDKVYLHVPAHQDKDVLRDLHIPAVDGAHIAEVTRQALSHKTVTLGPKRKEIFEEFHEWLRQTFPVLHSRLEVEKPHNHSLIFVWRGEPGDGPTLAPILLMAHMDVVPVAEETLHQWDGSPWGEIKDGWLYGRGSLDDKFQVVTLLYATEVLLKEGFTPKRDIYIALGDDEEHGGAGAAFMAKLFAERGIHFAMALDEGGVISEGVTPRPAAVVALGEKGLGTIKVTATANGGHAGMPNPETAPGFLARAIRILEKNPPPSRLHPLMRSFFESMSPEFSLPKQILTTNLWLTEPLVVWTLQSSSSLGATTRSTIAPVKLSSGTAANALPQTAYAIYNARPMEPDTVEDVVRYMNAMFRRYGISHAVQAQLTTHEDGNYHLTPTEPPKSTLPNSDAFRFVSAAIHRLTNSTVAVSPYLLPAMTDSRHYRLVADSIVRFCPMRVTPELVSTLHNANERIRVDNLKEIVEWFLILIKGSDRLGTPASNPGPPTVETMRATDL